MRMVLIRLKSNIILTKVILYRTLEKLDYGEWLACEQSPR